MVLKFQSKSIVRSLITLGLLVCQIMIWHRIKLWGFLIGKTNLWDLDIYWQMVRDVLVGWHPYQLPYMQTSGPPLVIAPFILFAGFSQEIARGLMSFLSLFAIFATSWILAASILKLNKKLDHFGFKQLNISLLIQLFIWLAFPTRFTLLLGQPNLILMWLVGLMLTSKSAKLIGSLAGLLTVFKTNLVLMLVSFLPKKITALIFGVGTICLIIILNFSWLKPNYYFDYLTQRASGYITTTSKLDYTDYYNQSLRSSLNRLNLGQFFPSVWVLSLIVGCYWLMKTNDLESGLLLSLILSPLTWSHYVVIVYPILILKISHWFSLRKKINNSLWLGLGLSAMLLTLELKFLHLSELNNLTGILASHYFIGLVLLLGLRVWEIRSQLSRYP